MINKPTTICASPLPNAIRSGSGGKSQWMSVMWYFSTLNYEMQLADKQPQFINNAKTTHPQDGIFFPNKK
jgi:hypothetical protein